MATIKSFTDIEQSKKLAKILSTESADMKILSFGIDIKRRVVPIDDIAVLNREDEIPCWSLAALLGVIRETTGYTLYGVNNVYMSCDLGDKHWKLETEVYDNEIDACYEMVVRLHELKML